MGALKAMFSFFTMLRIDIEAEDMQAMDRRFHLVPIIGAFYGAIAYISILALSSFLDPLAAAAVALFAISLFNRFLHLDGTMDLGDGLVVSGVREDHLRALKDSRVGAGGVAFAVFVILMAVAGWSALIGASLLVVVYLAEVFARNATVFAAAFGKPGAGMAGECVRLSTLVTALKSSFLTLMLAVPALAAAAFWQDWSIAVVIVLPALLLMLSAATGWTLAAVADRNFGMVNGDVLGATNELARPLMAFAALAVFTWMFW